MNLKETIQRYSVLKVLEKIVKAELEDGKAVVVETFAEIGAKSAVSKLPDGMEIATVSITEPTPKLSVKDSVAFQAYVLEVVPGALVKKHVEQVTVEAHADPLAVKAILERAVIDKQGRVVDPETGAELPGVAWSKGAPYPAVRFKPGGEDAVLAAWQGGEIDGLLALPEA